MDSNLQVLYNQVRNSVDHFNFSRIFDSTVSEGISSFLKYTNSEDELDYAKILIEALGGNLLDQKNFTTFLISVALSDDRVLALAKTFNLAKGKESTRSIRTRMLGFSKSKLKKGIIDHFRLEEVFFTSPAPKNEVWKETLKPFTPIPNDINLIPKSFLCLHDYQKRVKNSLTRSLLYSEANKRALVHMPTGSGKTKTSVESIIDFIRVNASLESKAVIVWFAHKKELCEQAYDTFKEMWLFKGDFEVDLFKVFDKSPRDIITSIADSKLAVVFIGFQKFASLKKAQGDDEKKVLNHLHTSTKLVVVDEAHKSLAPTYQDAIDFVSQMPDCRLVGLTATPGRSNFLVGDGSSQELAQYFHSNLISITNEKDEKIPNPLSYLQAIDVLAEVDIIPLEFEHEGMVLDNKNSGELTTESYKNISVDPRRNYGIVEQIEKYNGDGKSILVFASSKPHCNILQRILQLRGIESEIVLGETPGHLRAKYISSFKEKKLLVLINYGVLSTGFDAPKLDVLIIARPTGSIILYSQMLGRALRGPKNGGNKRNTLITIKDNIIGYPNSDFLFSYWEELWD